MNTAPENAGDDFLPLKEFAKNVSNPISNSEIKKPVQNPHHKDPHTQANTNISDLKSALNSLLKNNNMPKTENPIPLKNQPEQAKPAPHSPLPHAHTADSEEKKHTEHLKEIPEKDLKKVLGLEE